MNIAFFANHHKTYFFFALTKHLRDQGHGVFWISPGSRLTQWLLSQGEQPASILDLTSLASKWQRGPRGLPDGTFIPGPMQINAMIGADRFLREKPYRLAERYLTACGKAVVDWTKEHEIGVVLGEQTYALELYTASVLGSVGVPFLAPASVRIPSERFGLFAPPFQAALGTNRPPTPKDHEDAAALLAEYCERPFKPYSFKRHQGWMKPELSWLASPIKQMVIARRDPHELNRPSLRWLLRNRTRQVAYGQATRVYPFRPVSQLDGVEYVLMTLHRQPEASLDVLGYRFANQLELIRVISQELPAGWKLVVKEHSHGLGDRPPTFYRKAGSFPGVLLVDPWADSFSLASKARLTLTVSGSIAYEAGLLGLAAATFVPMYFGPVLVASGVNPYSDELASLLRGVAGDAQTPSMQLRTEFVASILGNSEPGYIGAPDDTPECMETDNLNRVAEGLSRLLDHLVPATGR